MHDQQTDWPNRLTAVVFKEGEHWFAMCLEKHIGSQGRNRKEAYDRLRIVYRAELDESIERTGEPFGGVMNTPPECRERLEKIPSAKRIIVYDKYLESIEASAVAA